MAPSVLIRFWRSDSPIAVSYCSNCMRLHVLLVFKTYDAPQITTAEQGWRHCDKKWCADGEEGEFQIL